MFRGLDGGISLLADARWQHSNNIAAAKLAHLQRDTGVTSLEFQVRREMETRRGAATLTSR